METEYKKNRRLAWFAFKDKNTSVFKKRRYPGITLSVQSFCGGYDAAQHGNEIKKISFKKFLNFCNRYWKKEYPHLRFGQAFLNKFFPDISCSEIFYEENLDTAYYKISQKFVDWKGSKGE